MLKPNKRLLTLMLLVLSGYATSSPATDNWEYLGDYDANEIFVVVESGGGFGSRSLRAVMAGSGRFALAGAYSDTTTVRRAVDPDVALAFINDLLAIDFMAQPEIYRDVRGKVRRREDGRLVLTHTDVIDSGSFRIALQIGDRSHVVTLRMPAYGAPEALLDWLIRFRDLVKEQAEWVRF